MADTMVTGVASRETTARLRHLKTSPTKIRPVLKLITGKDVFLARDTLRLCERGVAHEVGKLLDSAISNAEHNDNVPEDELFVTRAFADEGPTQKRWRPRARGRGTQIRKRTSHITIVVARFEDDELARRRQREAAAGGPARRRPTRRRTPKLDHDHDDHDDEGTATEDSTPKKSVKKAAKKSTAKKSTAKKAGNETEDSKPKQTAKKSTTKKSTTKKSTTKKSTTKKSTTKKSTAKKSAAKPAAADEDKDA